MDFAIGDGDSDASGSKSLKPKAYGDMQTRIKDAKNKKELNRVTAKAARPAKSSTNTTKRARGFTGDCRASPAPLVMPIRENI